MTGFFSAGLFNTIPDEVVSRDNDGSSIIEDRRDGLQIELSADFSAIGARISGNTSGLQTAYLTDATGSNTLDTTDISNKSAGDAFEFNNVSLKSGNKYLIIADANGLDYTDGYYNSTANYPYTGSNIDIVGGVNGPNNQIGSGVVPRTVNDVGDPDDILS